MICVVKKKYEHRKKLGNLGEDIVADMLDEAGYTIYRSGYERIFPNVSCNLKGYRKDFFMGEEEAINRVQTIPDFVCVQPPRGQLPYINFLEVKFRTLGALWIDESIQGLLKYWPQTRVIVVMPKDPFFKTATVNENSCKMNDEEFHKELFLHPLKNDKYLRIPDEIWEKYTHKLIEKYKKIKKEYEE